MDWRVAYGNVTEVSAETEVSSVDVPEKDGVTLLLDKDFGWTHDVVSVYPLRVEMRVQYRC